MIDGQNVTDNNGAQAALSLIAANIKLFRFELHRQKKSADFDKRENLR